MSSAVRERIFYLLDTIEKDFPRRKRAAEAAFARFGLTGEHHLKVLPAVRVTSLPTFDINVRRALSPMLMARFEHSGSWHRGQEIWLTPGEMALHLTEPRVLETHRALRGYWEGSAPMSFSDGQLGLFGITQGLSEDIAYLVWAINGEEPEIWEYCGQSCDRFRNLEEYLISCIESE